MPLPANIKDISADVLPAEVFLYPVCTTREGFSAMLEAMDNYYLKQHERVEVIKDFLNAQEYVANPLEEPCLKELIDELLASLPPAPEVVKYIVQECENFDELECDEMACSKCLEGSVIFCDGKLQYRKPDGTYADVPATAIPSGVIPPIDPENPIVAVGANACYKASGIWSYIQRATTALIDSANSSGFADDNYFNLQSSGFNFDNVKLFKFMFDWTDTTIGAGIHPDTTAYWAANKETIGNEFICALQDILNKEDRLSTTEYDALIHLADVFDTGLNQMNDLLFDAVKVVEKKAYETEAYNAVQNAFGECNCDGALPADDPLAPNTGCGIILLRGFGSESLGGWNINNLNPNEVLASTPKWGQVVGSGIKSTMLSTVDPNQQFGFVAVFEQIGDADWKLGSITATFTSAAAVSFVARDVSTFSALNATTDFAEISRDTSNASPITLVGSVPSANNKFVAVAGSIALDGADAGGYISAAITFYVYRTSAPGSLYPVVFNVQFC